MSCFGSSNKITWLYTEGAKEIFEFIADIIAITLWIMIRYCGSSLDLKLDKRITKRSHRGVTNACFEHSETCKVLKRSQIMTFSKHNKRLKTSENTLLFHCNHPNSINFKFTFKPCSSVPVVNKKSSESATPLLNSSQRFDASANSEV